MSVIPITVFASLGLVFIFVALFWCEQRRNRFASAERDSLLPLAEEKPRPVTPGDSAPAGSSSQPDPAPQGGVCATRVTGARAARTTTL